MLSSQRVCGLILNQLIYPRFCNITFIPVAP